MAIRSREVEHEQHAVIAKTALSNVSKTDHDLLMTVAEYGEEEKEERYTR